MGAVFLGVAVFVCFFFVPFGGLLSFTVKNIHITSTLHMAMQIVDGATKEKGHKETC